MQEALERAMAELVFGPALDPADHDGVLRWLERSGVTREDSAAILESDLTRLFVYRDLIRGTLWEAMDVSMPRVVARLGDVFEEYFDRFLLERGTRTHYLRDATPELLDFCEPLWKDDPRVPAYMMQLARHEYVQIEVGAMQAGSPDQEPAELDLEAPLAFVEAVRLMRYDWALHELPEDPNDETIPVERPTALFVYRNPEHEVGRRHPRTGPRWRSAGARHHLGLPDPRCRAGRRRPLRHGQAPERSGPARRPVGCKTRKGRMKQREALCSPAMCSKGARS